MNTPAGLLIVSPFNSVSVRLNNSSTQSIVIVCFLSVMHPHCCLKAAVLSDFQSGLKSFEVDGSAALTDLINQKYRCGQLKLSCQYTVCL